MADPSDCAPDGPRIEADLADFANWDPEDGPRFTAEDARKPRGAGVAVDVLDDSEALADQLALEAAKKAERKQRFADKQPAYSHMVNSLRVPQELFRSLERFTRVPFHTWFRRIEDGIDDVELATTDPLKELRTLASRVPGRGFFKGNREERKQVQRLFEARMYNPEGARELEATLPKSISEASDQLYGIYQRYFNSQDVADADIEDFFKAAGKIRENDGDFLAFSQHQRVPKIMDTMREEFKTGEVMLDAREWDFYAIGERLIRAHAKQTHLAPNWNIVKGQVDAFEADGLVGKDLMNYMHTYMDQVMYAPDHWQIALARTMNKITGTALGKKLHTQEILDLYPGFLSTNYFVNMAWNTGVALRNFMQPLTTSYPILGEKFMFQGYQKAAKALWDPEELRRYAKLGVITRDVEPMQANAIRESMAAARGPHGSEAAKYWEWFVDKGWSMFRSAENTNRIVSYQGMVDRAEHFGKEFMSGKISWNAFHEASKLDFLDAADGPITGQIRSLMEGGDLQKAAHLMGLEFTRTTQFTYRRGNTPYILQGTVGRLFGQYGTWPSWYASYMGKMAFQGSNRNKLTSLARWTGANAAIYAGAKEVFGVDMARSTFFSPFGYSGGPFVELSQNAKAYLDQAAGSEDPVDAIQAARLKHGYQQVIPVVPWGLGRNLWGATRSALRDDWKTATKRFLGFQPSEETRPQYDRR